jgi:hypothetical protein
MSACEWCKGVTGETVRCGCSTCHSRHTAGYDPVQAMRFFHMFVCPDCGNKRCPKATSHDLPCTGSNKPGQIGSAY